MENAAEVVEGCGGDGFVVAQLVDGGTGDAIILDQRVGGFAGGSQCFPKCGV